MADFSGHAPSLCTPRSFGDCVARLATTKTLWFTETAGNRVAQVTTEGDIFEYAIPTAASQPIGITQGA